jgi:hypothetical protein
MAKKPNDKNKKKAEPTEKKAICQYCKSHSNRPSKCKETGKYVPRKCEACEKYKEVK